LYIFNLLFSSVTSKTSNDYPKKTNDEWIINILYLKKYIQLCNK